MRTNGVNGPSDWSEVRSFTSANPPSVPVLLLPANGAITSDYTSTLNWSDSTVPAGTTLDHYQLQVATDSAFTAIVIDENIPGLTQSTFTPAADLNSNTRYYWRVRAFNAAEQYCLWSAARYFRTVPLTPVLLTPDDGATLSTLRPVFNWEDVSGVPGYTIHISRNNAFTSLVVNVNVTPSAYTPSVFPIT